jgi:nucleoside-diphosphate-sugar epimerase
VPVRELVLEVARQLGREDLLRLGARPSPVHDAPLVLGDASEAAALFGWAPQFTLPDGIADTISWERSALARM